MDLYVYKSTWVRLNAVHMFYVELNEPNPPNHTAIAFKFNCHRIIGTVAVSEVTGPGNSSKDMGDLTQTSTTTIPATAPYTATLQKFLTMTTI